MRRHLKHTGRDSETGPFSNNSRWAGDSNSGKQKDYRQMQQQFRADLQNFRRKRALREEQRDRSLNLKHIDYIRFEFFDVFDVSKYKSGYQRDFGLVPVMFRNFNREGLFVITDETQFTRFINYLEKFSELADPSQSEDYPKRIRFIKSFDGFTREDILKIPETRPHIVIEPFKSSELYTDIIEPLEDSFQSYLREIDINYSYDASAGAYVLTDPSYETLTEIADNFDHIYQVSSRETGIIRPSPYGEEIREYPFTVNVEGIEELPIIGVIDTGVSDQTPIAPLLVHSNPNFDITGTDPFDDTADHGTGVATLAALGAAPLPDYEGEFAPDARILPIKILNGDRGSIDQNKVLEQIRRANEELGVKIFVLTINEWDPKNENELPCNYSYALDRLAREQDLLICISTGNQDNLYTRSGQLRQYPQTLREQEHYLKSPAESLNNLTVGAIAENLAYGPYNDSYTPDRSFPAVYTRRLHYNWSDPELKNSITNKMLRKPDILLEGGDFDIETNRDVYGIKVVSSQPGQYFNISPGTSYAAPLAANLAAKLMRLYPEITDMQTVKALIVNSGVCPKVEEVFSDFDSNQIRAVLGYGVPDREKCLYSDDHRATFIIEDEIHPDQLKLYTLQLPDYLNQAGKNPGLLKVNATLCFRMEPVPDNQVCYCPLQISFGVFKDLTPTKINELNNNEKVVKQPWAQEYYYKKKILANTQKVTFNLSREIIENENNRIKIGLHSLLHRFLNQGEKRSLTRNHPFSLAISIEDTRASGRVESLYDELQAINELEAIGEIDIDLEH